MKWKHFPRYWPFVRRIRRSPVNSPDKGQWRGALMFSFICVWINGWVNNREAGDLRRYRAHYDVIVMLLALCEGNPPVSDGFPSQRPVTRSFNVSLIFDWTNIWANNRDAGDFRRYDDAIVMQLRSQNHILVCPAETARSDYRMQCFSITKRSIPLHSLWFCFNQRTYEMETIQKKSSRAVSNEYESLYQDLQKEVNHSSLCVTIDIV